MYATTTARRGGPCEEGLCGAVWTLGSGFKPQFLTLKLTGRHERGGYICCVRDEESAGIMLAMSSAIRELV